MSDRTQSAHSQRQGARDELAVIVATVDHQRGKYEGILPGNISFDDFRNAFLIAVQSNWRLLEDDRQSLWLALQKAAGDGLKPDGREGALVIFGDDEEDEAGNRTPSKANAKKRVVWMPMIRGLVKLIRNTGQIASIDTPLVYEGERVKLWWEDGERHFRLHRSFGTDFDDNPARIIGAIAIVRYKDGAWEIETMSRRQIDRVRAVSRAKKGPWGPWYDEMARKSVLRRLIKRLDQSAELRDLSAVLENDDTLATIEGEEPTDAAAARQIGAPDPLRDEFRAPFTASSAAAFATSTTTAAEPRAAQTEARTPPKEEPRPPTAGAHAPQDSAKSASAPEVEFWPADEIGEPLEEHGEPLFFRSALAFAEWFADRYAKSSNREALRENNLDALADAGADPAALKLITEALEADRRESAPAAAAENAPPALLVPIPRTPGGKEHWPNYAAACAEAIARIADEAGLDAWIDANKPSYATRAIEAKIERHLAGRRAELAKAAQPDADLARAQKMIADLAGKSPEQVAALADNTGIRTVMARWRADRPELFAQVKAAFDAAAQQEAA